MTSLVFIVANDIADKVVFDKFILLLGKHDQAWRILRIQRLVQYGDRGDREPFSFHAFEYFTKYFE